MISLTGLSIRVVRALVGLNSRWYKVCIVSLFDCCIEWPLHELLGSHHLKVVTAVLRCSGCSLMSAALKQASS